MNKNILILAGLVAVIATGVVVWHLNNGGTVEAEGFGLKVSLKQGDKKLA